MRVRDRSRGGDSLAGGRYRGLIVCPDDRRQIASTRRVEPPPAPASSARAWHPRPRTHGSRSRRLRV